MMNEQIQTGDELAEDLVARMYDQPEMAAFFFGLDAVDPEQERLGIVKEEMVDELSSYFEKTGDLPIVIVMGLLEISLGMLAAMFDKFIEFDTEGGDHDRDLETPVRDIDEDTELR